MTARESADWVDQGGLQPVIRGLQFSGAQPDGGTAPAVDMKKLAAITGAE